MQVLLHSLAYMADLLYNLISPMLIVQTDLVIGVVLAIVVILTIWIILLERRINRLLRGGKAKTIEEALSQMEKEVRGLTVFRSEVETYLQTVEQRLKKSVQGIGTVRFQAFKGGGGGGEQSFSSAFVNEQGDGLVISSIYSRGLVGIYGKPIQKGVSVYELTEEEREAITTAIRESKKK